MRRIISGSNRQEKSKTMEHKTRPHPLEDRIVAAIQTGAKFRGSLENSEPTDSVDRLVAMIESEAARIRGNDLSALTTVLANQALTLDTVFTELVKRAVKNDLMLYDSMRLGLKAQSQSRAAMSCLVNVARPRPHPRRAEKNFDEQTAANGNSPSR
jgi:hypothetical protein